MIAQFPDAEKETSITAATILFVDDDAAMRALFEIYLDSFGYNVLIARDGDEALRLVAANPQIDLMIMDVVMPGISGPSLAAQAQSDLPGLRLLYCSGHSLRDLKALGMDVAAEQFLQKPCLPAVLEERLGALLGG